ncbi:DUF4381 domain-containing protein [Thalassotalea sp. ND16A]|uniref:DUF4381 domain-containing protein n=1 Tax=Thalassotalea sp. ND16A TaxID=1535422 RepID=UPI00051A5F20|nr:DUF4381 domain-containing protein [Thalassotalea sp. ND16A]KGK00739.1 hypothetical protein ND16A_0223 [Thalassotalea sp. ND16A]
MDPLANLQDIHLPNDIHSWPVAPGWWLLLAVMIAIAYFYWKKIAAKRQQNLVKRQAIAQLNSDDNLTTEQSIAIIKWVAMHYFKRSDIAALHGDKLLAFLTDKLPAEQQAGFVQLAENALMQQYRKSAHSLYADELQQAAQHWVNHAMLVEVKAKPATGANNLAVTPTKTEVASND